MVSSTPHDRSPGFRWLIVLMLMGFAFQGHFNRVAISVAGTERFNGSGAMSTKQLGQIYSAFLVVYTIGMLPGGWVIDRLGPRRALTGMGLGMGFCVVLTGALGWWGWPIAALWLPLIAVRGLAGACSVPLHPGAARSISVWIPLSRRATANGLVTAGALVGVAVTYPGFGWLMDRFDWPLAFVVSGTALMLFATVWNRLMVDESTDSLRTNTEQDARINDPQGAAQQPSLSFGQFLEPCLNQQLVLLALSYAAVSYFQYLFFYWIEHYFEHELVLPLTESRRAAFLVTMAMALGMACGGCCSDLACHWMGRRWGCRLMALTGMGMSSLFAWIGVSAADPSHVVWWFSLALGALGLCEGIFWTTAPLLDEKNPGLACAFLNTVGNAAGSLAPVCTPWIGEHYGWTAALAVACSVGGTGAMFWLWINPETAAQRNA